MLDLYILCYFSVYRVSAKATDVLDLELGAINSCVSVLCVEGASHSTDAHFNLVDEAVEVRRFEKIV